MVKKAPELEGYEIIEEYAPFPGRRYEFIWRLFIGFVIVTALYLFGAFRFGVFEKINILPPVFIAFVAICYVLTILIVTFSQKSGYVIILREGIYIHPGRIGPPFLKQLHFYKKPAPLLIEWPSLSTVVRTKLRKEGMILKGRKSEHEILLPKTLQGKFDEIFAHISRFAPSNVEVIDLRGESKPVIADFSEYSQMILPFLIHSDMIGHIISSRLGKEAASYIYRIVIYKEGLLLQSVGGERFVLWESVRSIEKVKPRVYSLYTVGLNAGPMTLTIPKAKIDEFETVIAGFGKFVVAA